MFFVGLGCIAWAIFQLVRMPLASQAQTGLLLAGAALAGHYSVRARKPPTLFIGGDLFVFAALFLHGAGAAILVATAEIVSPSSRSGYRLSARLLTPFHTATSFAVGSVAYELVAPHVAGLPSPLSTAVRLCVAGITAMALGLMIDEVLRTFKRRSQFAPLRVLLDGYQGFVLPLACSVLVALLSLLPNVTYFLAGCVGTIFFVLFALRRWPVGPVVADAASELPAVDAVTGALLRVAFLEHVNEAQRSAEAGPRHFYAVVCIACDVSSVNRSLGYSSGEEYLSVVARRLRNEIRGADVLGRTEIDTFGVLLRSINSPADATGIAVRLAEGIGKPVDLNGMLIQGSANIGLATNNAFFDAGDSPFRAAERSLQGARALGPGHMIVFDDQPGRSSEQAQAQLPFPAPPSDQDRRRGGERLH